MVKDSKPNRGGRKNSAQKSKSVEKGRNFNDVLIRLIDALYDLAQTGNLIGIMILGFLGWMFLLIYKVPDESLPGLLTGIGSFFSNQWFYLIPMASALVMSVVTNFIQASVYKSHIKDLTEHRKALVHGLNTDTLKVLEVHNSSEFNIEKNSVNREQGE